MKNHASRIFIILCVLALIQSACNFPGTETPIPSDDEPSMAQQTIEAGVRLTDEAKELIEPSATFTVQATNTFNPEPPTATPEVVIEHFMMPDAPGNIRTWVSDISSEAYAPENRAIGDSFAINILERPFTSGDMEYQPYLDIIKAEVSVIDDAWIYIIIHLEGAPPEDVVAVYAFEADGNQDGRGDVYVGGLLPANSEWTTDGAFAYLDQNKDVGGENPMSEEVPFEGWDGYETQLFDSGIGDDPDMVWIRRDPSDPTKVQLAFKNYLVDADGQFLWGVWADAGQMDPGSLDYHDHFTIAEAGSPANSSSNYPLKDLASVDNSCRWTYGFEPAGPLPGLCPLPATPTPPPPPQPGDTPAPGLGNLLVQVYEENSTPYGTKNGDDVPMNGENVSIGRGACPSSGLISRTTMGSGALFLGLTPGTYCVNVESSNACGEYAAVGGPVRTVTITEGNTTVIYIGKVYNICSQ